jgi:hypothetical protein
LTNFYYSTAYHATAATPTNAQAVEIVTVDQLVTPSAEGLITYTSTTPVGTSVEVNTATSADNITYSGYSALGVGGAIASTPNRYLKIQFILHCPVDSGVSEANLLGPGVTNIAVTWTPDPMVSLTINGSGSATSGTWVSPTYDTQSLGNVSTGMSLDFTASYPANTGSTIVVDGANDPFFATIISTQSFSSPTSGGSLTTSGARYWRVTYALASTDGVYTPLITPAILNFNTTGTWLSPVITTTTDTTSFASLVTTDIAPAGTTVTTTIATSADNITWSAFTAVGSATPSRYAQIKCVLTSSDPTATATVSSIAFDWNLASTFVSQGIDTTGTPPAGYGLFTAVDFANGGTIIFYFRTASTLAGLNSASFVAVTPGTIPSNTPLQYIQWKAAFVAHANEVPQIDSVTSRWLIGNTTPSARVASLFFDKTYYLFAAQVGSAANNICFVLDYQGNWREFHNITAADIGTFFAVPYYLDATRNNIYQWMIPLTGTGFGNQIAGPSLGTASTYALLASTTITNTGSSTFTGDLGLFPGTSVTLGAGTVTGTQNIDNAPAHQAKIDALATYNSLVAMASNKPVNTTLSSATLTAGIYPYSSSVSLTGTLTLSGSATDVFIFQIASTLTTATSAQVVLTGGVVPQNVFWQVGSSATLGTSTLFNGNIIANTSITVDGGAGAAVNGLLAALNGAITFAAATDTTSVGTGTPLGQVPFTMDVRTKDFDLADLGTLKNARALWVRGYNTGSTINAYYSIDNGNTWISMLNALTGTASYTSTVDGRTFNAYFIPDYSLYTNAVEGVSVMFRITSSDSFPCQIISLRPVIYGRAGKYLGVPL